METPARMSQAAPTVDKSVDRRRRTPSNGKPQRSRGEVLDQMPPNALESERALLSTVFYAGGIDQDVVLSAGEFYDPRNAAIWETLVTLHGEGLKIDEASFLTELKKHRRWGLDGLDLGFIGEVVSAGGSVTRQAWHAVEIHRAYVKRIVSHHAEFLLQKARGPGDVSELRESLAALSEFVAGDQAGAQEPLPFTRLLTSSGLLALDLKPRFLVRGVMVQGQPMIIGGRSKTLKTSLAVDLVVSLGTGALFLADLIRNGLPSAFGLANRERRLSGKQLGGLPIPRASIWLTRLVSGLLTCPGCLTCSTLTSWEPSSGKRNCGLRSSTRFTLPCCRPRPPAAPVTFS